MGFLKDFHERLKSEACTWEYVFLFVGIGSGMIFSGLFVMVSEKMLSRASGDALIVTGLVSIIFPAYLDYYRQRIKGGDN